MDVKSGSLFATVTALAMSAAAQEILSENTSFQSGGKKIGVTVFRPKGSEPLASILVLHGAGGVDSGNAYVQQLASAVAGAGYGTYLVEYFDRTGTTYADDRQMRANADKWVSTLVDAVDFIAKRPGSDPERIGVFGYSLGGYLAVALSARDSRIRAVVELAGGIEPDLARTVTRLPPTLIVHGKEDGRVPFSRATELQQLMEKIGAHVETEYLPNERHILTPMAAFRALARALEFFGTHLQRRS
jgi:dienelactone hydrolase